MKPATRTVVEFPEILVRISEAAPVRVDLGRFGTGPLMWAMVNVANPTGVVIGHRVFAHADEIPFLDLATIRHRGRETTVTEWQPVPPRMPLIGTTLRATLLDGPETIEITDCQPIYRQVA
ncbi:hypothetical protein NS228_05300 [Methylobacterium indicum]|uniref:hypothetical protein n=1 Tax=Methylobacterium indicum TaxID=1775910 RepID=UPI000733CF90|nr:hypothetical protein [Methylobacterium indicum]KTS34219.1 hypothetical protein NS229_11425 [Methylobacterium indicum]KTS41797.1 hypothetical protein NS228_05300 [Methylobacterium indicum]KTS53107.1 hypothetical protein NS230_07675 [Methylobacterium indicum]